MGHQLHTWPYCYDKHFIKIPSTLHGKLCMTDHCYTGKLQCMTDHCYVGNHCYTGKLCMINHCYAGKLCMTDHCYVGNHCYTGKLCMINHCYAGKLCMTEHCYTGNHCYTGKLCMINHCYAGKLCMTEHCYTWRELDQYYTAMFGSLYLSHCALASAWTSTQHNLSIRIHWKGRTCFCHPIEHNEGFVQSNHDGWLSSIVLKVDVNTRVGQQCYYTADHILLINFRISGSNVQSCITNLKIEIMAYCQNLKVYANSIKAFLSIDKKDLHTSIIVHQDLNINTPGSFNVNSTNDFESCSHIGLLLPIFFCLEWLCTFTKYCCNTALSFFGNLCGFVKQLCGSFQGQQINIVLSIKVPMGSSLLWQKLITGWKELNVIFI